jgi:hypothetical protein
MFSHVVTFYTDPAQPQAADELIAGCDTYLKDIPGVVHYHIGKMVPSERAVVSQAYQVGLNLIFPSMEEERAYQIHPRHLEFIEKVYKRVCIKAEIFDFS